MNFVYSIYSQLLYWLALRIRVTHDLPTSVKRPLSKIDVLRVRWSDRLMAISKSVFIALYNDRTAKDKYNDEVYRLVSGIAYNPSRQLPNDPVVQ